MAINEIEYLFVDGAYLENVLQFFSRELFDNIPIELNIQNLTINFRKTYYYDCLPHKQDGETEESYNQRVDAKEAFFSKLRSYDGVHVITGETRRRKKKKEVQQKTIDVAIAVDMLSNAYHRNMDKATLLAGDLDFLPLVEALVHDGMYVTLWYEEGSASNELIQAADRRKIISYDSIIDLLPNNLRNVYPQASYVHQTQTPSLEFLLCNGTASDETSIALYQNEDKYRIYYVNKHNRNSEYDYYFESSDRELLLRYTNLRLKDVSFEGQI